MTELSADFLVTFLATYRCGVVAIVLRRSRTAGWFGLSLARWKSRGLRIEGALGIESTCILGADLSSWPLMCSSS
jgi:hypothetical protein